MKIKEFFEANTSTLSYVVWDEHSRDALIIDPVLDYDPMASRVSLEAMNQLVDFVVTNELRPHLILETHAHADHLSASQKLKALFPEAEVAIGSRITEIQETFRAVFGLKDEFASDGHQFDRLFDEEVLRAGTLEVRTIPTPGHTPACTSFLVGDALFTGDTLFMPDVGTGRCDFPAGSATDLYHSVKRLYQLPDATRVFVGHDYPPEGRGPAFQSSIGEQKRTNRQLDAETSEAEFKEFRETRDAGLRAPRLLYQSIQVNMNAGHLPASGYLRIPLHEEKPAPAEVLKTEREVELERAS